MDKVCSKCNYPMKFVQGGVSRRTNKPYNAFWSCSSGDKSHVENIGASVPQNPITQVTEMQIQAPVNRPMAQMSPDDKDLRIARESVFSSLARIAAQLVTLPLYKDHTLGQITQELVNATELAMPFIDKGKQQNEDVNIDDLPF